MTAYWWVDRALPGIVSSSIMAVVLAVSHLLLRRHITRTTDRQTATLTGSAPARTRTEEEAPMTEVPAQPEGESQQLPARESVFEKIADWVSAAMGRPTNIMIWLVLVVGWTLLFAAHIVSANANFLPAWFTGTAFNFPLNLITTVAELFIGFLVAAAANRSERNLEATLSAIQAAEDRDAAMEAKLSAALAANTALTAEVHELTKAVHAAVTGSGS